MERYSLLRRKSVLSMNRNRKSFSTLLCFLAFMGAYSIGRCETVYVGSVAELESAVENANRAGGHKSILLKDGTYTLNNTLYVSAPNVTLGGRSGMREKVVIEGDAMSGDAKLGVVVRVAASNFEIRDVTLQKCRYHALQIAGESNADNAVVRNCIIRDSHEQLLKVSFNKSTPAISADNGLVENCLFEYSAGIGPQYYIGGVDALGSKSWVVRNNTFRSIISPSRSLAQYAIHFWAGSSNNVVERNLIINCDRGIGFGMDGRGNTGGIIRNNMIYHASDAGRYDDVGISLTESPNSRVYNNTIYMENDFPWAIEYRFPSTTNVFIANNLTNKPIRQRDNASGSVEANVTGAQSSWFKDAKAADLHLAKYIDSVVDMGQKISGLTNDFDGDGRPQGAGVEIGADESASVRQ
jgi:hypothetical protein